MLDENQTGRFDYQVDRPVVDDGAILDVGWTGDAGYTGLHSSTAPSTGSTRRPSAGLGGGSATVAANWLLSQPEGLLIPPRGASRWPLRPAHRDRHGSLAETPVGRGRRHLPDRRRRQRGAPLTDVVAQGCGGRRVRDLRRPDRRRQRAARRRAPRRWWPTPAPGSECAGTIEGRPGCRRCRPSRRRRGAARQRRRDGPSSPRTRSPAYMYDLVQLLGRTACPNGGTVDGTGKSVVGPGRALQRDGQHQRRRPAGGRGARRLGPRARRRGQHRAGPRGAVPDDRDPLRLHRSGVGAHRRDPGRRVRRRVRPAVRAAPHLRAAAARRTTPGSADRSAPASRRCTRSPTGLLRRRARATSCSCRMGAFTDAAGHLANSDLFSNEFSGKIYADDELVHDMFASVFMNTPVPAGRPPLSASSPTSSARTRSGSCRPGSRPSGLSTPDHAAGLPATCCRCSASTTGWRCRPPTLRRRDRYDFTVAFSMPNGVTTKPVVKPTVQLPGTAARPGRRPAPVAATPRARSR